MEDTFEWVDNSLELFMLEGTDLLLEVLIFMSMLKVFLNDWGLVF